MKILIVHNHYVYPGGEDEVVAAEKSMLEKFGHKVVLFEESNKEINDLSFFKKVSFALKDAYWSENIYKKIRQLIDKEKPDIAHFHNTFVSISPSAYDACFDAKIPIVQTLHNYRFLCPAGTFYRNGRVCEDCLHNGKISAVYNKCWRGSRFSSLALSRIISNYEKRKILSEKIDSYIALSSFSRQKFVENGFDQKKITIKPNFLDSDYKPSNEQGEYGIFAGALRDYKGIMFLVETWKKFKINFPLKILGDGPLYEKLLEICRNSNIELYKAQSPAETLEKIKKSRFVIIPSECYENFPRVIIEAYCCGIPVIATGHGALQDLVEDGRTGYLFKKGDNKGLADKIRLLVDQPYLADELGINARNEYEKNFTVEKNYETLMNIYDGVLN